MRTAPQVSRVARRGALLLGIGMLCASSPGRAEVLDRFTGSYSGSGTVTEGPNASIHSVRCRFSASQRGAAGLALRGTCSAYAIISRSISADLTLDARSGRVTGTYTGARVGPASLSGSRQGSALDLVINWPRPVFGNMTSRMRILSPTPESMRIVVLSRIGSNGPVRPTTDLVLVRQ
jgi:hypothetical protein